MKKFEITLKNEKIKTYNTLSWLIIIIHAVIFAYLPVSSNNRSIASGYLAGLILLAAFFLLKFFLEKKNTKWKIDVNIFFMGLIIIWVTNQEYWLAVIPLALSILSFFAIRTLTVIFSDKNIIYPSFPRKKISWNELNNAMLRDGLVTIDFKNNKLIQQQVDQNKTNVNEKEFNEFCIQQLRTVRKDNF